MDGIIENDWIGSKGIFYNERTGKISSNISEVIDYANFDIDVEGLCDYLEFGYSVFGHTIVKDVNFLMPNEGIKITDGKKIQVYKNVDSVSKDINVKSNVKDTIEYMEYVINDIKSEKNAPLILPLSGGYDSRMIAFFLRDKSNVSSFTYGISKNQEESFEVQNAKLITNKLHMPWNQIELGDYYNYINDWIKLYGVSTHAHGMYQMEFYDKIKKYHIKNGTVLSGIVGDAWAGSVVIPKISSPKELCKLGYIHGISIDTKKYKRKTERIYKEKFFDQHKHEIQDPDWNVVWMIRTKMMLLKYLYQIPQFFGYTAHMPFLNYELCMRMLNLSWDEKRERKWQTDFLKKVGMNNVNKESVDYANMSELCTLKKTRLEPLKTDVLREFFDVRFLEQINANISKPPILYKVGSNRLLNASNYFFTWKGYDEKIIKSLNAYMLLLPIERLLIEVQSK